MKKFIKIVLTFSLVFSFSVGAVAQSYGGQQKTSTGTRKQLATIIFCGLGGAVLGLSTLSFYGRPQEKLSNIAVGFALGVIGGTIYSTYKTATRPYDEYQQVGEHLYPIEEFEQAQVENVKGYQSGIVPTVGLNFNF